MEHSERDRILKASALNIKLQRLYHNHLKIEEKLARLGSRSYLTPDEAREVKKLKLIKLYGKERMLKMSSEEFEGDSVAAR